MKTSTENRLALHFFVCCNERPKGDDCASKGGKAIRDDLKKWTKEQGYAPYVRINQAGCLGHCEAGVATVAYPQEEWFLNVSQDDVHDLKRRIEEWVVGAILSPEQLKLFETGTLVTIEPLSRVRSVVRNRLSRIGKRLPIASEDGKILFSAMLSQAEVVRFDEIPPVVLELLGYGSDFKRFEIDYRKFWGKYFSSETLEESTQLWVCVWRK